MAEIQEVFVLDPVPILLCNYFIGCLFLFGCFDKVRAFPMFRATLDDYQLVPSAFLNISSVIVIVLELGIGIGAFKPTLAPFSMFCGAVLLLVYSAAIGINLARGRNNIDCGCTGPATRQFISKWLVLRNFGLIAIAITGMVMTNQRALYVVDFALVGVALLGAMVLYGAVNQLLANATRFDALHSDLEAS
ncbi:MAG TPA: methylamine utilization protein MauE [Gammaproteobacteria bacterium]|nr:methylamine utilization protein MauE [Gammaproteobacteria bacterium]